MTNKDILTQWERISTCIADEISSNTEFAQKLAAIISNTESFPKPKKSNRRSPAKIDPFKLLNEGINELTDALAKLSVEELKDIIAANGMDTAKLAMKWKDRNRLEKHIIEATQRKASQGEAFWNVTKKTGENK